VLLLLILRLSKSKSKITSKKMVFNSTENREEPFSFSVRKKSLVTPLA
jgi:hypothetical protein